jgi:GntR family transcriptional regulator, phosphonate transport system regulatory protein
MFNDATMTVRMKGSAGSERDAAGVTLWRRVADDLERRIGGGTYPPNSRLPGELEIADQFGVNRHTVRRAIAALAERGMVRAARGSGTYVQAVRIPYPIRSRTRFSEIVGRSGREAGGRLLASATEPAQEDIARRLHLKTGAKVIRIEALRQADRVPICISTSWLPADRFPQASRVYATKRSMTRTLAHFGIRDYRRASTRLLAALADAADAMWLDLKRGGAVLIVDSVDVDLDDRPVLTSRARFAADRVEFTFESWSAVAAAG